MGNFIIGLVLGGLLAAALFGLGYFIAWAIWGDR